MYTGKTWNTAVENLNLHLELGSENYGMLKGGEKASADVYVTPRIDYTMNLGPSTVVPYFAYTKYEGQSNAADYSKTEFGVEVTTKF